MNKCNIILTIFNAITVLSSVEERCYNEEETTLK